MTEVSNPTSPTAPADTDLVAAINRVLAASSEPLTVSKLRSQLPSNFRQMTPEELADVLRRQADAKALHQYPPYRSQQDRFWDRSMPLHVAALLRTALEEGPLPWSQLRRKLPVYALAQSQAALDDQLAQGRIYRHPRGEGRGGELFGLQPPDPKAYLEQELSGVFVRLEKMGFNQTQVRESALELLHNEEWAPAPPPVRTRPPEQPAETSSAAPMASGQTPTSGPTPPPLPGSV